MADEPIVIIPSGDFGIEWSYKLDTQSVPGEAIVRLTGKALHDDGTPFDWNEDRRLKSEGHVVAEDEVRVAIDGELSKLDPEAIARAVIKAHGMKKKVKERLRATLLSIGFLRNPNGVKMEKPERIDL